MIHLYEEIPEIELNNNIFSSNFIFDEPSIYNFSNIIFFENESEHIEQPVLKEMKSENENFMKEKDIKFELYPLYINWKKIEEKSLDDNNINYNFVIFKLFGYFGEAIFEILLKLVQKLLITLIKIFCMN